MLLCLHVMTSGHETTKGNPMNWYLEVLRKYAVFSGRARRKEYWTFFFVNLVIGFIGGLIPFINILVGIYGLAILIPSIAVSIRRLHDTNRSGFWLLVVFVPVLGAILLLVFFALDGDQGENQYGPNPKADSA